jgi:hypothetical protein
MYSMVTIPEHWLSWLLADHKSILVDTHDYRLQLELDKFQKNSWVVAAIFVVNYWLVELWQHYAGLLLTAFTEWNECNMKYPPQELHDFWVLVVCSDHQGSGSGSSSSSLYPRPTRVPQGMAIPWGIINHEHKTLLSSGDITKIVFALPSASRVGPQWVNIIIACHCSLL